MGKDVFEKVEEVEGNIENQKGGGASTLSGKKRVRWIAMKSQFRESGAYLPVSAGRPIIRLIGRGGGKGVHPYLKSLFRTSNKKGKNERGKKCRQPRQPGCWGKTRLSGLAGVICGTAGGDFRVMKKGIKPRGTKV